jgi:hypothetical protein
VTNQRKRLSYFGGRKKKEKRITTRTIEGPNILFSIVVRITIQREGKIAEEEEEV